MFCCACTEVHRGRVQQRLLGGSDHQTIKRRWGNPSQPRSPKPLCSPFPSNVQDSEQEDDKPPKPHVSTQDPTMLRQPPQTSPLPTTMAPSRLGPWRCTAWSSKYGKRKCSLSIADLCRGCSLPSHRLVLGSATHCTVLAMWDGKLHLGLDLSWLCIIIGTVLAIC